MGSDLISKPLPAATVMLLRDGDDGMEVLMIVRHHNSDVHAGALVFPGGRVDAEDYELAVDATVFPSQDGVDAATAVLRVAAVRETIEECGVLLARARGEEALVSADRLRDIEAVRRAAMTRGQRSPNDLTRISFLPQRRWARSPGPDADRPKAEIPYLRPSQAKKAAAPDYVGGQD
jgi:8-oxo-dGTP pyrophosphatase MutT (NUDIX family)